MTKYLKHTPALIVAAFLALAMSSCLDEDPRDRVAESEAFDTPTHLYLNTIANIYSYIGGNSDSQGLKAHHEAFTTYARSPPTKPSSPSVVVTGMTEVCD